MNTELRDGKAFRPSITAIRVKHIWGWQGVYLMKWQRGLSDAMDHSPARRCGGVMQRDALLFRVAMWSGPPRRAVISGDTKQPEWARMGPNGRRSDKDGADTPTDGQRWQRLWRQPPEVTPR